MEDANSPSSRYDPPKIKSTWVYIIIIVLLLATNFYLFLNKAPVETKTVELATKLAIADSALESLQTRYKSSLERLDLLLGKNAELDAMIKQKDAELLKSKSRIEEILKKGNAVTQEEYSEAQILIASLNSKISVYEEQIKKLRTENKKLNKERDSVAHTNVELQQKINLAKVLHASNIRLKAIDLRRGGRKEKETEKAKRVDLLRITFDIDENKIAESGAKELFICIINPQGELLSNNALGSGSFLTPEGTSKYYSTAKNIMLQTEQPLEDIVVDWQQTAEYEKGAYFVEIYHQGYLIGKGSVNLR